MSAIERRAGTGTPQETGMPSAKLDIRDIEHEPVEALGARGTAYAREYARIQHSATTLKRNLAVVIVALRMQMGDLEGSSHEYRTVVADMYRRANLPDDVSDAIKAGVRYHISNELRRHLTPRELSSTSMLMTSAVERMRDRRAQDRALIDAVKLSQDAASAPRKGGRKRKDAIEPPSVDAPSAGLVIKATADQIRLASVAARVVAQLDEQVIRDDMTAGQRTALEAELAGMAARVSELRRKIKRMK